MPEQPLVLMEQHENGVAIVTLNRPEKRNAMSSAAQQALLEAFDRCRGESKVVILTGAGPAFCAGVDLKEQQEREAQGIHERQFANGSNSWIEVQEAIRRHPAIFVAAVNGFALGGGTTLINSCDLAIAANEAQIGMPEVGFGMYPGMAGPSTQLRILPKHAAWMVLTAERIDGQTAERWGLVNRSVPLAELMETALALADRLAQLDAVTLDWCKKALWEIPMHVQDWLPALEFGQYVGNAIRANTGAIGEGLGRFAAGQRNVGQGA